MSIDTGRVRDCLKRFDFRTLFVEELGWNICNNRPVDVQIDTQTFRLSPFAEQGGMVIYLGESLVDGNIPPANMRRIIETRIAKLTHEHMIVFLDRDRTRSVWQWVRRQQGKQTAAREHTYYKGQPGDSLLQKLDGIAFRIEELDDKGQVAIIKVLGRVTKAFDVEKVTKRFYDEFKKEHDDFSRFLRGLEVQDELAWYTSVMLNRLMFIYFIQKKGFLDKDTNYLANKLRESKRQAVDQFYKKFLIRLFFEGFAKEEEERTPETKQLLGDVPYLNGGIFQKHKLEEENPNIAIPDAAFERIITFFDGYSWHLDYRPLKADNEINPDVLGYIFEKYINQKQMGAYYTKEDITDYICKNTIIPYLFDKLENMRYDELHPFPMKDVEPYIYDAAKTIEYLPTETEREYQARQKRYQHTKDDFAAGKIADINDLITYNLDIRKFAEDWVASIHDPVTLRAFYFHCLTKVTVLDPAVGSGAFLFAALNMLEPLYEICLDKMEELGGPKYPDFADELKRIGQHANRQYFILKSIIVNNLFGVDIMEEAVEICKLRLFLKLVAQVDDVDKIEPLPDIDFNIRAGNTLVGYTNLDQIRAITKVGGAQGKMDLGGEIERIDQSAQAVDRAFQSFRALQTRIDVDSRELSKAKAGLKQDLGKLQDDLNHYLAGEYGIDVKKSAAYERWLSTHQPFHWFVEFYGIMKNGGFDAIIGNPPYVEYTKVKDTYAIRSYDTEGCGNLYAFMVERSMYLLKNSNGRFGMIVPISIVSSERMSPLRKEASQHCSSLWVSNFAIRPQPLFAEIMQRNTVVIAHLSEKARRIFSTGYLRWVAVERDSLFKRISMTDVTEFVQGDAVVPKVSGSLAASVLRTIKNINSINVGQLITKNVSQIYFHDSGESYWTKALLKKPIAYRNGRVVDPAQWFAFDIPSEDREFLYLLLNSNLVYWLWTIYTDCRHMTQGFIKTLPLPRERKADKQLVTTLIEAYARNTRLFEKRPGYSSPEIKVQNFRPVIDEIDRYLGNLYGFTEEELDFIINYDIKYRMGKDNEEGNNDN